MDTTISYLKQQYTLRPSEQVVHGKKVKKIMISPFKESSMGYVWKDDAKGSGVWLNTHKSLKFPLSSHELFFLNEVMTRFGYYWNKIN